MALTNPYIWANQRGIPRLEATGVTVSSDAVTFAFNQHRFLDAPFVGLILFKLPSFDAPSTAVPIVFSTNGTARSLTTTGGTAVTSSTVSASGIYLCVYDSPSGTLQLLAPVI